MASTTGGARSVLQWKLYDLRRADDGRRFDQVRASSSIWAGHIFLSRLGDRRLECDVLVVLDGRVLSIVSDVGAPRPSVLSIFRARQALMGRDIEYAPATRRRKPVLASQYGVDFIGIEGDAPVEPGELVNPEADHAADVAEVAETLATEEPRSRRRRRKAEATEAPTPEPVAEAAE
jgi:hypothetical protein